MTFTLGVVANRDEFSTQTSGGKKTFLTFDFGKEIQPRVGFTYIIDAKAGDKFYGNFGRYNNMDNRSLVRAAAPIRSVFRGLPPRPSKDGPGRKPIPSKPPTHTKRKRTG